MEILDKFLDAVDQHKTTTLATALVTLPLIYLLSRNRQGKRIKLILKTEERVLVIGASSGVGRKIANLYAQRGARVCVVGRRAIQLEEVKKECLALYPPALSNEKDENQKVLALTADMTKAEDLVAIRERLQSEWGGVDTLHITAGVSALRPLLEVAGSPYGKTDTTIEGIKSTAAIAQKAIDGNFIGPLMAAVTFIPQLQATSKSPSVLLISTVAALIPAPTRTLYGSTKSASLMLYRSLSVEHPKIQFSYMCPATIQGNFRASAVDGGQPREVLEGALSPDAVAERCVRMVDWKEGIVLIPFKYSVGLLASWISPGLANVFASRKYEYQFA